jgi:hypothetical protein
VKKGEASGGTTVMQQSDGQWLIAVLALLLYVAAGIAVIAVYRTDRTYCMCVYDSISRKFEI